MGELKNFFKKNIKLILIIVCGAIGILILYKLLPYFAPFIVALIFSFLMEPLISLLMKRLRLKRKAAASLSLFVMIVGIAFIVYGIIINLVNEVKGLLNSLPGLANDLTNNISPLIQSLNEILLWIPEELSTNLYDILKQLTSSISTILESIVKGVYSTAASLPQILIFVIITILATFFFASDKDKISSFIRSFLPGDWVNKFSRFKNDMLSSVFKLLQAYIIILLITMTELWIGLSVIGINYSLLLAIVIGIIDILPVLGTGTVLIPWSIYSFVSGDIRAGASLIILYFIILIVRQVLEPKIIGQQIGVHPLVTLMFMYVGLRVAGVAGLLLGPIVLLMIKIILPGIFTGQSLKQAFSSKIKPKDAED